MAVAPGEPPVLLLVEDPGRTVEQLGELDAPAGAALDRVVGLDPADREDLIGAVDHVVQRLEDAPDERRFVVRAPHVLGDDLHRDVALGELGGVHHLHVHRPLHRVALERERRLRDAVPLGRPPELGLGSLVSPGNQLRLGRRHGRILSERLREIEREYTAPKFSAAKEIGMRRPLRSRETGRPLLFAALLAFAPAALGATNYTIVTTVDDAVVNGNCTLREAIRAANTNAAIDLCAAGGPSDVITLPAGTYPFVGQENLLGGGSLTIRAQTPSNPPDVTIDLSNATRFLSLGTPGSYVLDGLGIVNGVSAAVNPGGAITATNASLSIYNFLFESNDGGYIGGAIYFFSDQASANLVLHNGSFVSNSAVSAGLNLAYGGAVTSAASNGADIDIRDVDFTGNSVADAIWGVGSGALALIVSGAESVGRCTRCSFLNNSVTSTGGDSATGGAIEVYAGSGARVELVDCRFQGNAANTASPQKVSVVNGRADLAGQIVLERIFIDFNGGTGGSDATDVTLLATAVGSSISVFDSQITFGTGRGLKAETDGSASLLLGHLTIADYDFTGATLWSFGGSVKLQNSIVSFNGTNLSTIGTIGETTNFIGGDPLFLNAPGGDYHLDSGSPAINSGTNGTSSHRPADLDHHARITGLVTDKGCYEFNSMFMDDFEVGDTGSWSSHSP